MRPDRAACREGFALLEVLVAIALLGGAGLSVVALLRQAITAEGLTAAEERRYADADRVLAALTLLSASELDQRLGRHPLGEFRSEISRPEAGLYRVAVAPADTLVPPLLVTVVARAEGGPRP